MCTGILSVFFPSLLLVSLHRSIAWKAPTLPMHYLRTSRRYKRLRGGGGEGVINRGAATTRQSRVQVRQRAGRAGRGGPGEDSGWFSSWVILRTSLRRPGRPAGRPLRTVKICGTKLPSIPGQRPPLPAQLLHRPDLSPQCPRPRGCWAGPRRRCAVRERRRRRRNSLLWRTKALQYPQQTRQILVTVPATRTMLFVKLSARY